MTVLTAPFRPFFRRDTYRVLAFLAAGVPVGAAALGLLIAGWVASAVLLVTPLVVAALIGFRGAVGLLAAGDAALAARLLDVETRPRISSGGTGYWRRGRAIVSDASFWRQQIYLALRLTIGFALAVAEFSLFAAALDLIAYPIVYRWNDLHFWSWHVDSFERSLALVPVGIVGLVLGGLSVRLVGRAWAQIVRSLLGEHGPGLQVGGLRARNLALGLHAGLAIVAAGVLVLVWGLAGQGSFWPEWALLPLALVFFCHGWIELVARRTAVRLGRSRGFAIQLGVSVAVLVFLVVTWAITGAGTFWPVWAALGLALALAVHLGIVWLLHSNTLTRRIGQLEATRAGAVDAQGAELRRIERDLHDGAQARLVALGMNLGLAEQRFASDPESARRLVAEARQGVGEALRELRDLARGIHPPILSDRGLGAAVETLADQTGMPITVSVALDERLSPAVEAAAYFVIAETLANAAKHSGASRITVEVARRGDVLALAVVDDGSGGADAAGGGLTGLRRRVEALDGTLSVVSPRGGPTVVRAELPCGS